MSRNHDGHREKPPRRRRNAMIEGHRGVKTASPSHFLPPPGRNLSEKEREDRENRAESKSRRTGCERRREDDKNRSFSREREREGDGRTSSRRCSTEKRGEDGRVAREGGMSQPSSVCGRRERERERKRGGGHACTRERWEKVRGLPEKRWRKGGNKRRSRMSGN